MALAFCITGCAFSTTVPASEVIGEHVAEYAFGTDRLVILEGGEFRQTVTVGRQSVVQRGDWRIEDGKLVLHRWIDLADEAGELNAGWHRNVVAEVALPVERIWFRVVVGSGASIAYRKVR